MNTRKQIIEFISQRMRTLARSGGSATVWQLAAVLLAEGESQFLHHEHRIKKIPLRQGSRRRSADPAPRT